MELIYIGDEFYKKSCSMMSSIYGVDGSRQDWGFVNIALKNGQSVHIRPATPAELAVYDKKLQALLEGYET